jgi:hypothetical protein
MDQDRKNRERKNLKGSSMEDRFEEGKRKAVKEIK